MGRNTGRLKVRQCKKEDKTEIILIHCIIYLYSQYADGKECIYIVSVV